MPVLRTAAFPCSVQESNSWCAAAIENVGSMTAAETVQLYLAPPCKVAFAPPQILTGFARRTLAPGEAAEITFTLARRDVSYYSPAREVLEGGGRRL